MHISSLLERHHQRCPAVLVDGVAPRTDADRLSAFKLVSVSEDFFQGHFPGVPLMPGVLMLEALAQAAALLSFSDDTLRSSKNSVIYFVGIDGARFKRPVEPGDQLILEVEVDRIKSGIHKFKARAKVGDALACEAQLMCTMRSIA